LLILMGGICSAAEFCPGNGAVLGNFFYFPRQRRAPVVSRSRHVSILRQRKGIFGKAAGAGAGNFLPEEDAERAWVMRGKPAWQGGILRILGLDNGMERAKLV
jgi:hypothetical protein